MGDQLAIHLDVLRTPTVVQVSGNGAKLLSNSLSKAWAWCLADSRMGNHPGVTIDAVLDEDPALLAAARDRGAVVGSDVREVMHQLTPAITTAAITYQAGALLMLHACAVAHPQTGAAVVLVGPSGIGKTTAARTLGSSFAYLTDETAAIHEDRTILPFPKPLSVLQSPGVEVKDQISPAALGLVPPTGRPTVSAVVLLDRQRDAGVVPRIERIPTLHALALLAPETSFLVRLKSPLRQMAQLLSETGGLRRVTYREAKHLPDVVRNFMEGAL